MSSWTRRASILAAALALTAVGATTAAASATTAGAPDGLGINCRSEGREVEVPCSNLLALVNHGQVVHRSDLIVG